MKYHNAPCVPYLPGGGRVVPNMLILRTDSNIGLKGTPLCVRVPPHHTQRLSNSSTQSQVMHLLRRQLPKDHPQTPKFSQSGCRTGAHDWPRTVRLEDPIWTDVFSFTLPKSQDNTDWGGKGERPQQTTAI